MEIIDNYGKGKNLNLREAGMGYFQDSLRFGINVVRSKVVPS